MTKEFFFIVFYFIASLPIPKLNHLGFKRKQVDS